MACVRLQQLASLCVVPRSDPRIFILNLWWKKVTLGQASTAYKSLFCQWPKPTPLRPSSRYALGPHNHMIHISVLCTRNWLEWQQKKLCNKEVVCSFVNWCNKKTWRKFMSEESDDSACFVSPLRSILWNAIQLSRLLRMISVCVLVTCWLNLKISYISLLLIANSIYMFSSQEVYPACI